MTNKFDIHEWRMQQALRELNEKLDAVGKEDSDINNDGKTNSTDKYLMKRRQAIAKNIKEQPAKMVHDAEDLEETNYSLTEDDWMQADDESDMAHGQLYSVKDLADKLCNMIDDGEQLDAWVQAKLTKAGKEIYDIMSNPDIGLRKEALSRLDVRRVEIDLLLSKGLLKMTGAGPCMTIMGEVNKLPITAIKLILAKPDINLLSM